MYNSCINTNPIGKIPEACRDKDDNNILHLAKHIQADLIITGDKDLLVLIEFDVTRIINPRTFIERYHKSHWLTKRGGEKLRTTRH